MYEHPVFCLASQVMDLTIREYPDHPLPALSSLYGLLFSFKDAATPAMLAFICAFMCQSEWRAHQSRNLWSAALNRSGVLF